MSIVTKQLDEFKMPLGPELGLGPVNIVLDGGPAPSVRGTAPNFRPMSIVVKRLPISPTAEVLFLRLAGLLAGQLLVFSFLY